MAISFSPQANVNASHAYFGNDPSLIFTDSKTPVGYKTTLGVTATSRVAGVTAASATVTVADTSGISTGDYVGGAGCSAAQSATTQDTGDTFTINSHGAPNGTPFYLTALATTTGVSTNKLYYVVGTAANTFQAALTPGGSAIALTTDGTASVVFQRQVVSITTNTSIVMNVPASATAASTVLRFIGRNLEY